MFFFFFSSRRRHTRYWRDWSSDVCSSDLAGQGDRLIGAEAAEEDAGQGAGQRPGRPAPPREDAVVAGGVAGGQPADGPQEVGDGATAGGQDGAGHEGGESPEGRRGEGAGEGPDQPSQGFGYNGHGASLLVGDGWCYPHLTNKEVLLVDAYGPQEGQKSS